MVKILTKISVYFWIFFPISLLAHPIPNSPITTHKAPIEFEPLLKKFKTYADQSFRKLKVPGSAIAIIYQNEIIMLEPYGVKRLGQKSKIDLDTVFQLGSISKPVTATLATVLATHNKLRIDDPLYRYLPNFELQAHRKIPAIRQLKVRNLLNHTTGVPRTGFNNLIETYMPYHKMINQLQKTPVQCSIGHCYDYHNVMFGMIGDVIAAATKQPFKDALENHLLKPLNMKRTSSSYLAIQYDPNKAQPHIKNKRGIIVPCAQFSQGYYAVAPAGGVNSSIRDMATFVQAQLGRFPDIVGNEALNLMHEPQIPTPEVAFRMGHNLIKDAYYGLGWRILNFSNEKVIFHGGWLKGFNNMIAFLPAHKVGIVVLQNSETRFAWKSTIKFLELFLGIPEHEVYDNLNLSPNDYLAKVIKPKKKIKPARILKKMIKKRSAVKNKT